jgi:hypothetical protein
MDLGADFQWSQKVTVIAPDTVHILGKRVGFLAFAVCQALDAM